MNARQNYYQDPSTLKRMKKSVYVFGGALIFARQLSNQIPHASGENTTSETTDSSRNTFSSIASSIHHCLIGLSMIINTLD